MLAQLRCTHRKRSLLDDPCGGCSRTAFNQVKKLGEDLIVQTARVMVRLDGFDCAPTPLTYQAAVDLLAEVVPLIRKQHAAELLAEMVVPDEGEPEPPGVGFNVSLGDAEQA
jgi:hypothetical protein